MQPKLFEQLKVDLLDQHWLRRYNWAELSTQKIARMYRCEIADVRKAMREVAAAYPKPPKKETNDPK